MEQKRLASIDVLRGADMFLLTTLGPLVMWLSHGEKEGWLAQFYHTRWEGFTLWDLIMPLFMFLAGVTIPFAFAKYVSGSKPKSQAWLRILRRVLLLWILGMVAQGNLLKFDWASLKFFSNTLQAIAVGYLVCSLLYLYCQKPAVHVSVGVMLMLAYWAAMMFISIDGCGGGDFSRKQNLAQYIDIKVLGTHRDGYPNLHYYYTWILSSLTFAATVMMGLLTGEILRGRLKHKGLVLILLGILCLGAGELWGLQMPVIKKIWTSSMVLVAGGLSMALMGIFYWLVDETKYGGKALGWLKIYGMNAIVAYMIMELGYFFGIPDWVDVLIEVTVLPILWHFKIFVKV